MAHSCQGSIWEVVTQLSHFWQSLLPSQTDEVLSRFFSQNVVSANRIFTGVSEQAHASAKKLTRFFLSYNKIFEHSL